MFKRLFLICLSVICLFGCKVEEEAFSGIRFETDNVIVEKGSKIELVVKYINEDSVDTTSNIELSIPESFEGTLSKTEIISGDSVKIIMPNKSGIICCLTATCNGISESICLGTLSTEISVYDSPIGFASVDAKENFGGLAKGESCTVVKTRDELISAVEKGGIIYIEGMIDMSDGMLPSTGGGSTKKLDEFVASKTSYANYAEWKNAYGSVSSSTDDRKRKPEDDYKYGPKSKYYEDLWKLNEAYKENIQLNINSDTTIIGIDENSGIKGVALSISSKNNILLRNLVLQDGYDPFTHHEPGDGFNAQFDLIGIQGSSKNIWIDHCTLEDTMKLGTAANGEKWQTYDGLCDMKASCKNITISNCIFRNHDKTMLIGSSDSDGSNKTRHITICGNYFQNCGQRLPMVRNAKAHIFNNYYANVSGGFYSTSYCIGNRAGALIVAENNYFNAGSSVSDSAGSLCASGNRGLSNSGSYGKTFNPKEYYEYILDKPSDKPKENAGAGKLPVIQ